MRIALRLYNVMLLEKNKKRKKNVMRGIFQTRLLFHVYALCVLKIFMNFQINGFIALMLRSFGPLRELIRKTRCWAEYYFA